MNESEMCGAVFREYGAKFPGISRSLQVLSHCLFTSLVHIYLARTCKDPIASETALSRHFKLSSYHEQENLRETDPG